MFSLVQSLSHVRFFATPWIAAHQASLSITNSRSSHKLTSIKSVMPSSHLILCHPLLLLPPIPPSIRVFSNESTLCMRWPKSTGVSALASFPPKKSQGWSPSEWTGKKGEKTTLRMGENNSKWNNWQRINFHNIQAAHTTQYQKNKQPNSKSGEKT